jgi:hypothetical protein
MKRIALLSLVLAIAISAFSSLAVATPIRATFNGTVSGGLAFSNDLLNEFPIGTAASFDVTFDDSGLLASAPLTDLDLAPVFGTVRLGALEWLLNAGRVTSYTYLSAPGFEITSYGLQLTGNGPLAAGDDSFFGLFLGITPTLDFVTTNPYSVGFRSPFAGGETYGYTTLSGTSRIERVSVSVSEPDTLFLASVAFAAFAFIWVRRKRTGSAPA